MNSEAATLLNEAVRNTARTMNSVGCALKNVLKGLR